MGTSRDSVRLRDTRKAGHCWQDNELYDVFQPIIGAYGISVYVHLTRHAMGSAVAVSLRELAGQAGIGKDTVRRALLGMELVGMIRRTTPALIDLVDLKELAAHYGASYDFQRRSYVISADKSAELRAQVRVVQAETQGKKMDATVSLRDEIVSQRDSDALSEETELSSQRDKSVSLGGHASIVLNTKTKTNTNTPLPPSQAKGERDENSAIDADGEIADAVVSAARTAGAREQSRLRGVLLTVIAQERAETGLDGDELLALLVQAWEDYCRAGPALRWSCQPQKFFATGLWRRPETWPYAQPEGSSARGARAGMYLGPT